MLRDGTPGRLALRRAPLRRRWRRARPGRPGAAATAALAVLALAAASAGGADDTQWPSYGNDPGGTRYAPVAELTPQNVGNLEVAWVVHTGDVADGRPPYRTTSAFQATPLLVDGTLFLCTPFNRVLALDPATGEERWSHDPGIDRTARYANQLVCRGVSAWRDAAAEPGAACALRILTATADARLIALDAASGRPCAGFGEGGEVDLARGVGETRWAGEYQVTSPPAVAGDLVLVGSAVSDNARVGAPSGVVRAFDARSGALAWAWDAAPPGGTKAGTAPGTGWALSSPNAWAPLAVDEGRDLVVVPTGNPTPDYVSSWRRGLDHYGSSVVALRASTGALVWRFQTVHHDVWDYDVPAQPTLVDVVRDGARVPAVVQATKMGLLFVLHRESGEPLFPVEERPVPQGTEAEGFTLSRTQPFPLRPPPLVRHALPAAEAWGLTPWDRGWCRDRIAALRNEGIYTPPSARGTLVLPGNAGGSNWGGVAVHPERQLVVANTMNLPFVVTLLPRERFDAEKAANPDVEHAPQEGTPWGLRRELLLSPLGLPCSPPPWGTLAAVDLGGGEIRWQVPLGTVRDVAPLPVPWKAGVPNLGGPLVTAGGLVFIGAAADDYLRAFDLASGEELWKGRLPAGGQATPMTYRHGGRQYVVIAAGGHGRAGTTLGDAVVAFALPE